MVKIEIILEDNEFEDFKIILEKLEDNEFEDFEDFEIENLAKMLKIFKENIWIYV